MKTYHLIWRMILYRPWLYLADALTWILIHVFPVVPGLIIREFFDMLVGQSRLGLGIWGLIALLVATATAHIANIAAGALVDIRHRFTMSGLLRRNALESMLASPVAGEAKSTGETVNILEEDAKQVEDVISWSFDMMGMTSFAIVSAVILIGVSPQLTLMVLIPMIFVVMLAQSASGRLERYRRESRKATSLVTEAMGEAFGAVQAIKVANAEDRVTAHLKVLGDRRRDAMLKDKLLSRILDSIFENASRVGTGIILLVAARYLQLGALTVGDFALFVYYLDNVTEFAAFFGYFNVHYRQAGVALARLGSLVKEPKELVENKPLYLVGELPEIRTKVPDEADRLVKLTVKGLTASYLDGEHGIEDVSFELERGTFTAVTGRIGSGKTTMVRALLGLMPRDSGEVFWNGKLVEDPRAFFVPPRSAYAPQVPHLFSDTMRNNILLGIPEGVNLQESIKTAALEEDLADLEKGIDTLIGPKGTKLSGGQQQRTAVARMLVRNAEFMVFDDVSSALDIETEKQLWQALADRKDLTYLVITNRWGVIMGADKVLVMNGGRVIAQDTPDELIRTSPELRAILEESGNGGV
ncbi:MAG TPA: ABC transporter ATP-binding protein [Bacillota bacterium]|nr:ABC transporter ATP-binding protein [Bacillota bacterium]HOH09968.1 ABC transporter ATP-binding protein [Bacillota bacterium]